MTEGIDRTRELWERSRLREEVLDDIDEEIELELDDSRLGSDKDHGTPDSRRTYFRELLRLQGELVKLQDWIKETGHRLVVICEGRDAAGKGGDQTHYPAAQSAHMSCGGSSCPNDRERTQWYFQRYVSHLPQQGRSCCLTAVGTTVPVWNGS